MKQLSLFSYIQFSQILPLHGPVPVYLLFIPDCNHPAQNNHSIGKRRRLSQALGKLSLRIGCVCIRTSLYSLYKCVNLPKTNKQQVLAVIWTRKNGSQPLFSLTSIPRAFAEPQCQASLFLGYFSPRGRSHFSAKGSVLPLYVIRGQQRAPVNSLTYRSQTGAIPLP